MQHLQFSIFQLKVTNIFEHKNQSSAEIKFKHDIFHSDLGSVIEYAENLSLELADAINVLKKEKSELWKQQHKKELF